MARPRTTLPPNSIEIISGLASRGFTEVAIAAALGIDISVWRRIRESDPRAKAAWQEARTRERDTLVNVLFEQATTKGNIVAAMFLLKSRHGFRDQGAADGSAEPRVAITLNLPAPLKPDQYQKLIELTPHSLPAPKTKVE